jgi:hypothetical protein
MIRVSQFNEYVIAPGLQYLTGWTSRIDSEAARNLMLGTALQESKLTWMQQATGSEEVGAHGFFQQQLNDHDALWRDYLEKPEFNKLQVMVLQTLAPWPTRSAQLRTNLLYSCIMARLHYWFIKEPLPGPKDVEGLAAYWKKYYNTLAGEGTTTQFVEAYSLYIADV